jgi:hypothetical protein
MSETSVRVAGDLVGIGLKFTFEPAIAILVEPLKEAAEAVEVISLLLPLVRWVTHGPSRAWSWAGSRTRMISPPAPNRQAYSVVR